MNVEEAMKAFKENQIKQLDNVSIEKIIKEIKSRGFNVTISPKN